MFSAGWTFPMLAGFFGVIDVVGWKRWAFPLVVVGMNSIAMYGMAQLIKGVGAAVAGDARSARRGRWATTARSGSRVRCCWCCGCSATGCTGSCIFLRI